MFENANQQKERESRIYPELQNQLRTSKFQLLNRCSSPRPKVLREYEVGPANSQSDIVQVQVRGTGVQRPRKLISSIELGIAEEASKLTSRNGRPGPALEKGSDLQVRSHDEHQMLTGRLSAPESARAVLGHPQQHIGKDSTTAHTLSRLDSSHIPQGQNMRKNSSIKDQYIMIGALFKDTNLKMPQVIEAHDEVSSMTSYKESGQSNSNNKDQTVQTVKNSLYKV